MAKEAYFRFYGSLNDFLPPEWQQTLFSWPFQGKPSIKDAIEALGVPHTEVYFILKNGKGTYFTDHVYPGDTISIYPLFHDLDISEEVPVYPQAPDEIKFILDTHLGRLAKYLRMLGFDTLYENDFSDVEILKRAEDEERIVLTRDLGILKFRLLKYGYFIRNQDPTEQLIETVWQFGLIPLCKPFHRCMECNGEIQKIDKSQIRHLLKPDTAKYYHEFFQCQVCKRVYWKGSHFQKMQNLISDLKKAINFENE